MVVSKIHIIHICTTKLETKLKIKIGNNIKSFRNDVYIYINVKVAFYKYTMFLVNDTHREKLQEKLNIQELVIK